MAILKPFFDFMFSPLVNNLPPQASLVIISVIITFLITISYKFLSNQQVIKAIREEIKQLQHDMREHKDNKEKFAETNKKAMMKNLDLMKHSMKPTLYTFIPIILLFTWLRATYLPAGDLFSWGFNIPFFGTGIGWLWTYILTSLIANILFRKALKVS